MDIKIRNTDPIGLPQPKQLKENQPAQSPVSPSSTQITSKEGAQALKALTMSKLSFKGSVCIKADEQEYKTIIKNLFEGLKPGEKKIDEIVPSSYKRIDSLDVKPLVVTRSWSGGRQKATVTDFDGNTLLEVSKKPGIKYNVSVATGKPGLNAIIKVPDKKLFILINEQGEIHNKDIDVVMKKPSDSVATQASIGKKKSSASFMGGLYSTMAFRPAKSEECLNDYREKGFNKDVETPKKYKGNRNRFTPVVTIGGYGSRIDSALDARQDNKPSLPTPAGVDLLHHTLDNIKKAGLINDADLSVDSINKGKVIEDNPVVGTAGGVVEGIIKGIIPADKPLVICSGDGLTDINYGEALKDFSSKPDAGLMIVGYPFPTEKMYSLGIMDLNEKNEVKGFIEKPKKGSEDEKKAIAGSIKSGPSKGKVLANTANYIIGPKAAQIMVDMYMEKAADELKKEGKTYNKNMTWEELPKFELDFGKHVMPKLCAMANNETLNDDNGTSLKMYAHVGEDSHWNDVGTLPSFIESYQQISRTNGVKQEYKNIPHERLQKIKENVDPHTGAIYTADTRKKCDELGLTAKGNVIVMDYK